MNEVNLLSQLNHHNVVKCEGYFRDNIRKSLFIILEYCKNGDLKSIIDNQKIRPLPSASASNSNGNNSNSSSNNNNNRNQLHANINVPQYFHEKFIWSIFTQLCEGLKHLHEHGE
jgi:serine/threonine protein kinase